MLACADTDWTLAIALVALVVSSGALFIAIREHRVFMRELTARAVFETTLTFPEANRGVIVTQAAKIDVLMHLGIKNNGNRAATATLLNLIVPAAAFEFEWVGPQGQFKDIDAHPATTHEVLTDPDGTAHQAQYLSLELPRISRKPHYVRAAKCTIAVPEGSDFWFPVIFAIQADEMPDDVDEVRTGASVRIVREAAPALEDVVVPS